jgi:hypothetical protein
LVAAAKYLKGRVRVGPNRGSKRVAVILGPRGRPLKKVEVSDDEDEP